MVAGRRKERDSAVSSPTDSAGTPDSTDVESGPLAVHASNINILLPKDFARYSSPQESWKTWLFEKLQALNPLRPLQTAAGAGRFPFKKVVIIGVHGWFPNKLITTFAGQPTGTSDKFVSMMNEALMDFIRENYVPQASQEDAWTPLDLDVTSLAVNFQGKIHDRVATHLVQLEPNKEIITQADLVLFVTHSQGVPVSAIMLSELIKRQIVVPSRQRVGFLAMAGINHGPFPSIKNSMVVRYFEADAARELFELNDPQSNVSIDFKNAILILLDNDVRISCVAGWFDQVVPLYSATMHGFQHPNIFRSIFIEAENYSDDFLTRLIYVAIQLRNHGLPDKDLLVYLSDYLAGSVYSGQGHSLLYNEKKVYVLALKWTLEGPKNRNVEEPVYRPITAQVKWNSYHLPWILHSLLSDPILASMEPWRSELRLLTGLFEIWMPQHGALQKLRYKLEPLQSRL